MAYIPTTSLNIVLDDGGTNEITIHSTNIEEVREKTELNPIIVPSTTTDAQATKTVDLLRISANFTIQGYINATDKSKLRNIMYSKGPVIFTNYDNESFDNTTVQRSKFMMTKFSITKDILEYKGLVTSGSDVVEEEFLPVTITGFLAQTNIA